MVELRSTTGSETLVDECVRCYVGCLAGGLFGGGHGSLRLDMGAGGGFVAGQIQVGAERVQGNHGELGAEGVEFAFGPATVQAHGAGDVLRKGLAIVAFADEDVAD